MEKRDIPLVGEKGQLGARNCRIILRENEAKQEEEQKSKDARA
jgi:hypothetical protein